MAKEKNSLNTMYVSERLQECLRPISHCAMTTVIAPMGYGKTTAVMGMADEFTAEMAEFVTENPDTSRILAALTGQNAFVSRLPDGQSFRFHHMMKECAERDFFGFGKEKQASYQKRYGAHRQYIHALTAYRKSENYAAVLDVVRKDAGILMTALNPADVLQYLASVRLRC